MTSNVVTAFPYPTVVRDDWITLSDGCRLFARTVLPEDADRRPVPAVLEYLPYRLSDGTAHRDATIHPYFAGHGYASVRVDIRGTGNSDGLLYDEYLPQEQADGCEVIAWLADQPWCSGAVGLFGKSWGGFNALQIAARRPPAVRAVISAYFTDDRYADEVHYLGGCVLAHEALPWASFMLGLNGLPPDPLIVGDRWREIWHERLEHTPFFAEAWLRHQRRDAFWRQGSVCEDFAAIQAPTLLVGGWADGYTNPVGRTLAGLNAAGTPCRALLGPWSHGWPHVCEPGPRIGFLQECVRWWDRWLRELDNGVMAEPLLRVWMQEYDPPAPRQALRSGHWRAEDAWPPAHSSALRLLPRAGGGLSTRLPKAASETIVGSVLAGSDAGAWCPYGEPTDFPPDQRAEDGLALAYTTSPLRKPVCVLGYPEATLELVVDRPQALVAVRLCDVAPDGRSLLVARGLLNLSHRHSHVDLEPMPVGEPVTVGVSLDLTGHVFAAGHRVRLAISPTYWPFAWPSPEPVALELRLGAGTIVRLPTCRLEGPEGGRPRFGAPEQASAPNDAVFRTAWRTNRRDLAADRAILDVGASERSRIGDLEFGERVNRTFSITTADPLSARVGCEGEHHLIRGDWQVKVSLRTSMSATATMFTITSDLDAFERGVRMFSARRSVDIPRDGV